MPNNTSVVVDIDVHTPKTFVTTKEEDVIKWVKDAHDFEKQAFFNLLPEDIINQLKEA